MRLLAGAVALSALSLLGCTTDVGEAQIPPVPLWGRFYTPSGAAQKGVQNRTWVDAWGEQLSIGPGSTADQTQLSTTRAVEFFTKDEVVNFKQQLNGHTSAVKRIDIKVAQLTIKDVVHRQPVTVDAFMQVAGTALGDVGSRTTLPSTTCDFVMQTVDAEQPVVLDLGVVLSVTPDQLSSAPGAVDVVLVLQPILTVDDLQAL
jgi:hypothetical protein